MTVVKPFELLQKQALVLRCSARELDRAIRGAFESPENLVVIDFDQIVGVSPSFIDETLTLIDELTPVSQHPRLALRFLNMPTTLSAKFRAIGDSHALAVSEEGSTWELSPK